MPCPSSAAFKANLPPLSPFCALMQCGVCPKHATPALPRPTQEGPHRTAASLFPALSSSRLRCRAQMGPSHCSSLNSIACLTVTVRAEAGSVPQQNTYRPSRTPLRDVFCLSKISGVLGVLGKPRWGEGGGIMDPLPRPHTEAGTQTRCGRKRP